MKKTFLFKAVDAAMWVFTIFGASAFLLTVLALCGVPMGWQIGVCSVLPGCVIIQGLVAICRHERRKMKNAFIAHHVAELEEMLKELESWDQEEDCRFHEDGKCTFGDGLPECAKEEAYQRGLEEGRHQCLMNEMEKTPTVFCDWTVSCEDAATKYVDLPDGLRLISQKGKYVGWYVSGEEGGGKDA